MSKGNFADLARKSIEKKQNDPRHNVDQSAVDAFTAKSAYTDQPPPSKAQDSARSVKRGRKPKRQGEKGETYTFRLHPKFINELDDKLESLPRHITRTDLVRLAFSIVSNMPTNQIIEMLKNEELELAQEQDGE